MDEDEEYVDHRDKLLRRFRESLGKPMSERYFDEDDLIEIFDYAGDLNDDYLRMEALMCGARYFPDSADLLERRGIFYSQYSDGARTSFLNDNPTQGSLILELLNLRNNPPSGNVAEERLNGILDRYDLLTDEEVIQLVDLAASINKYDWLKANIDRLRKKAAYPTVLIYETAIAADTYHDNEYSARLLEELTEIEPFNSYYWMMLSRQYAELDDGDKAVSAIDYSLAINPSAPQSLIVKAKLLYAMEKPVPEVVALAKKALKQTPRDVESLRFLASVYFNEHEPEKARKLLYGVLEGATPEEEVDLIPDLLLYEPSDPETLLDRFYNAAEDNSQFMWASWAQQLSMQGHPLLAKKVVECFERNSGVRIPSLFAIEDAFAQQNFDDTLRLLTDYISETGAQETDFPTVVALHIISYAKAGAFTKAYALCSLFENSLDINRYRNVSNRLEYIGLMHIIQDVKQRIADSIDPADWAAYDPLGYWSGTNHPNE